MTLNILKLDFFSIFLEFIINSRAPLQFFFVENEILCNLNIFKTNSRKLLVQYHLLHTREAIL